MNDEMRKTVEAAMRILGASPPGGFGFRVELQGQYRGMAAQVKIGPASRGGHASGAIYALWRLFGPTHGVKFSCSPPAVFDKGKNFTQNAAFNERYSVNGAAPAVMRHVLTPDIQTGMLVLDTQLRFEDGCVECLASGLHDDARAAGILELARISLQSLPGAVEAGKLEPYVPPAPQPMTSEQRKALTTVAMIVVLALAAVAGFIVLAIVILGIAIAAR
jgi:hypothetical protein